MVPLLLPPTFTSLSRGFRFAPTFYFYLLSFYFYLLSFYFCLLSFYFCLLSFYFCLLSFYFYLLPPTFTSLSRGFRFAPTFYFCLLSFYFYLLSFYFCLLSLSPILISCCPLSNSYYQSFDLHTIINYTFKVIR